MGRRIVGGAERPAVYANAAAVGHYLFHSAEVALLDRCPKRGEEELGVAQYYALVAKVSHARRLLDFGAMERGLQVVSAIKLMIAGYDERVAIVSVAPVEEMVGKDIGAAEHRYVAGEQEDVATDNERVLSKATLVLGKFEVQVAGVLNCHDCALIISGYASCARAALMRSAACIRLSSLVA